MYAFIQGEFVMLTPINTIDGFHFSGIAGGLINNIEKNWLLTLPETNPAILDMFRERDRKPYRDMLPWSGEFAGKYITGAYYIYKTNHSEALKEVISEFICDFCDTQGDDGYLGCYNSDNHLTGCFSDGNGGTWDSWSHYHAMYGMWLWNREFRSEKIHNTIVKAAGLFMNTFFGEGKKRLKDIGWTEMNLAVLHIFTVLASDDEYSEYRDSFIAFIRELEKDVESDEGGGYISCMDAGLDFYQCRKPRWESLHVIMGILAMSDVTGDPKYADSAEKIALSILRTDVHNTGAFSTNEQAVGSPYKDGAIELCCVIAYNALIAELYLRRPSPLLADFLEKSYYNAIMGSYSASGRWSTYNTPMDGQKRANYQDIVFQSRPGSPDLNCCSANSGRGLGQLSSWAIVRDGDSIYVNFYEACRLTADDGVQIKIAGGYPLRHNVSVTVCTEKAIKLYLRIPSWSEKTKVNGVIVNSGEYYGIDISSGENKVNMIFDFSVRLEDGRDDKSGKRCVYCGPLLYGIDLSANTDDLSALPKPKKGDFSAGAYRTITADGELYDRRGKIYRAFYRLGSGGSEYKTWLG